MERTKDFNQTFPYDLTSERVFLWFGKIHKNTRSIIEIGMRLNKC
jgi:hypothetical protein